MLFWAEPFFSEKGGKIRGGGGGVKEGGGGKGPRIGLIYFLTSGELKPVTDLSKTAYSAFCIPHLFSPPPKMAFLDRFARNLFTTPRVFEKYHFKDILLTWEH